MKSYTLNDVRKSLTEVGIGQGDCLLVHSSLFPLGRLDGHPASSSPHQLVLTLLDLVGDRGTLVAPTFSFDFCSGLPYDRRQSPSKGMGVLSETIRLWPGSRRSPHAMQPVSAIGRHAAWLTQNDTPSSFGVNGPFARLLELDAKLLLLGAPMQAASLVHLAEERRAVPYRYWKCFTGVYIDQGIRSLRTYQMYVRDLELNPILQLSRIAERLTDVGRLATSRLGAGQVQACRAADFIETTDVMLAANPYALVQTDTTQGKRAA